MSEEIRKWSTQEINDLIEIYRQHENLWNSKNLEYKNRIKRIDSYKEIAEIFGKTLDEIERKIKNIISQYNRERKNYKTVKKSGAGQSFRAKWFGNNAMTFLNGKNSPRKGIEIGGSYKESESSDDTQSASALGSKYTAPIMEDCIPSAQPETTSKTAQQKHSLPNEKFTAKKKNNRDSEVNESTQVLNLMKSIYDKKQRDVYDTFREMVPHSIRNLKWEFTKNDIQHEINNLLYEARKSEFEEVFMTSPSSLSTPTNTSDNSLASTIPGELQEYTILQDPILSGAIQETGMVQLAFGTALGNGNAGN